MSDQVNKLKMPHVSPVCTRGDRLICSIGSHVRIAIARQIMTEIGYSSNHSFLSSYLDYPTAPDYEKSNIKIAIPPDQRIHTWIVI